MKFKMLSFDGGRSPRSENGNSLDKPEARPAEDENRKKINSSFWFGGIQVNLGLPSPFLCSPYLEIMD